MSGEVVPVTRPEDLAALPIAQRGEVITRALEESKSWLAVATKGTDPTPIAEFRAWAATVAEMTRQKGLAEDVEASWPDVAPGEVVIFYAPDARPPRGRINVYFVYDECRELLYIGQTRDVRRRLRQHRRADPWWWRDVAFVQVIAGNSLDEADQLERATIGAAHPPGNQQHRRRVVSS